MAPSWQQRQEAVCHPFNRTDPDTLWTHPSNWIKQFIFTFSTFLLLFLSIMSHPMRCTPWKHRWAHAVGKNDALKTSPEKSATFLLKVIWRYVHTPGWKQSHNNVVFWSLMSHDVVIDRNNNDEEGWLRFRCIIFFNLRALWSSCEVPSTPRALSLMH